MGTGPNGLIGESALLLVEEEHGVDLEPALIRHRTMEEKTALERQRMIGPVTNNIVQVSYNLLSKPKVKVSSNTQSTVR